MEEERIKVVRDLSEPQSVRDIQVFLGFANFYRRFIKNFSRITAPLTSILQTTGNDDLGLQASGYKEEQDVIAGVTGDNAGGGGESFKNLSMLQNRLSPKGQILQRPIPERIFLLPEPKKPSYTYKKFLPRLRFLGILIQSVIFGLKLMLWGMLLIES